MAELNSLNDEYRRAKELRDKIRQEIGLRALENRGANKLKLPFKDKEEELTHDSIRLRRKNLTVKLRKIVAYFAIGFVALQLGASNLFFGVYLFSNLQDIQEGVMIAWLSATVVEVIGILGIVTISLFPNKNDKSKRGKKRSRSFVSE